jgi:hypothetical protein
MLFLPAKKQCISPNLGLYGAHIGPASSTIRVIKRKARGARYPATTAFVYRELVFG